MQEENEETDGFLIQEASNDDNNPFKFDIMAQQPTPELLISAKSLGLLADENANMKDELEAKLVMIQ